MGYPLFTNNAATGMVYPISSSATTLIVNGGSGSLFPAPTGGNYFMLTLISQLTGNMEIVQCTARSGDTFTIVRAQEGTTAQAFAIGDGVQLRITAGSLSSITNPVVVDSVIAGTGIGVSSSTGNVTISNTGVLSVNGSTGTVTVQGVPSGALFMWPTSTAPTGYLNCNGTAVSRTTYSTLFAVVGTTFGTGDGTTTFNLPNYTNRMPYGTTIGSTGGSADAVVVSHTHTATVTDPGHTHAPASGNFVNTSGTDFRGVRNDFDTYRLSQSTATASAVTGISVANATAGVSGTNANLPPYLGINFIIKT